MQKSKYSKEQILSSKQISITDKYLIKALLDDSKTYTVDEVVKLIAKEKKRGVK